ncbi:ligand-binding sensor domain-containing diguanylate cyclase [Pleionea sediminis]|uniref:ligand-binding sensor domain-containing diguanylate cyclase n=1 Tax=Pleionea sediminis TaxID=2569479 RepID=UPI001185146E|nr:two-component regulator propeller domain-containing protein [Pleionea sediminis]
MTTKLICFLLICFSLLGQSASLTLPQSSFPINLESNEFQFDPVKGIHDLELTINAVVNDDNNFIWVGTQSGLLKIDAYGYDKWDASTGLDNGLINNLVTSLAFDKKKKDLWVGTIKGISVYNLETQSFRHIQAEEQDSISHNHINRILIDSKNRIWVATNQGLNLYKNDTWQQIFSNTSSRTSSSNNVLDITEDRLGNIWVSTVSGLSRVDNNSLIEHSSIRKYIKGDLIVTQILASRDNGLWLGTEKRGLFYFNPQTNETRHYTSRSKTKKLSSNYVASLFEDEQGRLWIGTGKGICLLKLSNGESLQCLNESPGLNNIIISLFQDNNKILWVGTWSSGLYRYDPEQTPVDTFFINDLDKKTSVIKGVDKGLDSDFWLSNESNVFKIDFNDNVAKKYDLSVINPESIYSTFAINYNTGTTYLITNAIYELSDNLVKRKIELPDELKNLLWYTGSFDSNNRLWLSSTKAGVFVLDENLENILYHFDSSTVPYFKQINKNTMLFGDSQNVYRVNIFNGEVKTHTSETHPGLKNTIVSGYLKARDGRIWMTTPGGLHEITQEGIEFIYTSIGKQDGLPSETLTGPIEDKYGHLWMGSEKGLIRYDPSTNTHQFFGQDEGALNQYYIGEFFLSDEGRIVFLGPKGFSAIHQEYIKNTHRSYPTVINELLLKGKPKRPSAHSQFNKNISYTEKLIIPPDERDFALRFTTTLHSHPRKLSFFYKLDGFDDYWIETDISDRLIKYTNLNPGRYVFNIHSRSATGKVGPINSLDVIILAHWYETIWFEILVALVVIIIITSIFYYKTSRYKRYNKILEEEVEKRTQDVRLLASLGKEITSILNIYELVKSTYHNLNRSFNISVFAIGVCEYNKGRIRFEKSIKHGKQFETIYTSLDPEKDIIANSVRFNKTIHITSKAEFEEYSNSRNYQEIFEFQEELVVIPLKSNQEHVIGCVFIQSDKKNSFKEKDINFIETIANYTSIALNNTITNNELEQSALIDQHTGIYNRRAFTNFAKYQISVAKRSSLPVTFMLANIDGLKELNDSLGQTCGDMMITRLSSILKRGFRTQDFVGRWEGDKFALMFPNTDINGTKQAIEKVVAQINMEVIIFKEHEIKLSVTFGLCELELQYSVEEILDHTDSIMSKKKNDSQEKIIICN